MLAGTYERQHAGAGIRHVRSDVQKVFEKPKGTKSHRSRFSAPPKKGPTQKRHKKFAKRAAKNHDRVAKPAEEKMPAFVNDQIDVVNEEESAAAGERIRKKEQVENDPRDSRSARNLFPFLCSLFEKGHGRCAQRSTDSSASYAAPSSGADSLRTTDTGILFSRPSNFHLS